MPALKKFQASAPLRSDIQERYLDALVSAQSETAASVLDDAVKQGMGIPDIYTSILCESQAGLGRLWVAGKLSITQVQVATQISMSHMGALRQAQKPKEAIGLSALLCVPNGENHTFASRVIADLLAFDGWDVFFPGSNIPENDLLNYVREREIDVVIISMTMKPPSSLTKYVEALKALPRKPRVVLGGPVAQEMSGVVAADLVLSTVESSIGQLRNLMGKGSSQSGFRQFLTALGEKIQTLRKSKKLSQKDLALSAGLDRAYLSAIENGKQNISLGALYGIAEGLGVSIEEIIKT